MLKKTYALYHVLTSMLMFASIAVTAQNVNITAPVEGETLEVPVNINLAAEVEGVIPGEPVHLKVINNQSGYRKLKLGNNPSNLYSPKINVIGAGNDRVEITLKDLSGSAEWSRIRFRPSASGSLNLAPYISEAGGNADDWTTISIPLADFDASIDFTAVNYIEFPYSADAEPFVLGISEIKFTGGQFPVVWFGPEKYDNIHNGNGGPGELLATLEEGTATVSNVDKIEFLINGQSVAIDTEYPYSLNYELQTSGEKTITAEVHYLDGYTETSPAVNITATDPPVVDLAIEIDSPQSGQTPEAPASVEISAEITGAEPQPRPYIHVTNQLTGYRKLKLGYNSGSIYGPNVNPVYSGNDTLEIFLADAFGTTNWSKIRIRPAAKGILNLSRYVDEAGGVGPEGNIIKIPLADFSPDIDFSSIAFFEFPYSADAGNFDLKVYSVKFTGGDGDFIWFGENKTDNAHDGNGGPGQLVAETVVPDLQEDYISSVTCFLDGHQVGELSFPPFEFNFSVDVTGTHEIDAVVTTQSGIQASSNTISFEVVPPAVQYSALNIQLIKPADGSNYPAPATINSEAAVSGMIQPEPAYLLVSNTQTGYRKLKFGNNPNSIYGPKVDVIAGGNHTLEITMKKYCSHVNWNKIRLRPQATGILNLDAYIDASGSDMNDWTTISIPLADFSTTIDFTNLAYLEFPYSADAGNFEIGIKKVEFTGGAQPYLWFGDDKLDNAHNGNGGGGELMATLVEASDESLDAALVEYFMDGSKIGENVSQPWQSDVIIEEPGTYTFSATVTDTDGLQAYSDTATITVEEISPGQGIFLTILFDEIPENVSVAKAKLKYNKDFAYSFTLDDGRIDAYTYAYQLFNGGYIEANSTWYPGLFYTDGCGNDIPFRAALAWNSVNSNYQDLHINTPDYITWTQLGELYEAGWDVLNHSYSHAAYGNTDYHFEITQNRDYVNQQAGIDMTHFVPPSGDDNYIQPAFDLGNKVVYTKTDPYLGYMDGLPIDDQMNFDELRIYRKMIYDDAFTPDNVSRYLDDVAQWSTDGNHYWWTEFTHRVRYEQTGASLVFPTFEYYMNYIEQTYGKSGSDRIWMAPVQEVYEYLLARDKSVLTYALDGNELTILLEVDALPADLRNYFVTLVVDSDASFSSIETNTGEVISFDGNAQDKLINLSWDGSGNLKSGNAPVEISENQDHFVSSQEFRIYPNPVENGILHFETESSTQGAARIRIVNTLCKTVLEKVVNTQEGLNTFDLHVDDLTPGIYFLRFEHNSRAAVTRKVIIK